MEQDKHQALSRQTAAPATRRPRGVGRKLLFSLLPLAVGWALMEIIALVWVWPDFTGRRPAPPMLYVPHPYRVFTLAPNVTDVSGEVSHNSLGFRGRDLSLQKPPATVRIVCHGGSTTYGPGAKTNDHTYPAHMERFLREHYAKAPFAIEVINAAGPAYTAIESLVLFQTRILDFSPDVMILHHGINDTWVACQFNDYETDHLHARHTFGPLHPHWWEYSAFLTLLLPKARTPFNPYLPNRTINFLGMIQYPWVASASLDAEGWQRHLRQSTAAFERNVRSFVAVARGNGIIPVLSTMSYGRADPWFERILSVCNDRVRAVAAEMGLTLVDFARELPWNPRSYYDVCHLRDCPEGLERKGRIFADALIGAAVIEQAARRAGLLPEPVSSRPNP